MSDFQDIVHHALHPDIGEDVEMDTTIDKYSHWQRICTAGIAAVGAASTAWLQLTSATSNQSMPDVDAFRPSGSSGKSKCKRKVTSDAVVEVVSKNIAACVEELSRAIVQSADKLANKVPRTVQYSVDLFEALRSLDLDKDYLFEAYEFLSKHEMEAHMFLGASIQYRADILKRIMDRA